MTRVAVIGAGFAGLAAASELAQAGRDVIVLEARDRVGGRVWSDIVRTPDGAEAVIERGGEFILQGYDELRRLAARHGLSIADTGMSYYVREPRGSAGVDAEALSRAGASIASAADTSGRTVADVIAAAGLPAAVGEAVRARVEISCALESERLAPAVLEHVASFTSLPSHRIASGNQSLAEALASTLGDRLALRTPVRGIERRGHAIRVLTSDDELEAEEVVLALPLPVLRELPIDPPLPDWKHEALAQVEIGQAAKLHLPLATAAPTSAVMSVPLRFWCWTATSGEGAVTPVLNCFAGSPTALDRLEVRAGVRRWVDAVRELRPELDLAPEAPVLTTWQSDPYALGAYRADGVVRVDDAALEAPVDGLHFAGEWAAGAQSGLMEGALRSGMRAAGELVANSSLRAAG
ncbi:MAG TPA: NAD(P)/FAD-dependent oxidoreductase [Solirubrobacteraceae bacterium]|nr:NAD(P)/FAD-dependent oxidoreductase [Solirubrobacteraceae bacterium]